jgi:hypothetical protein
MRPPMNYGRGAEEAYGGVSLTPGPEGYGRPQRRFEPQVPAPTGMPGGIMGERNRMDQFREFGQSGGFDPIRERLMAGRGGGAPPPPQAHANPFFDRMYQQPPSIMGRPGPPIQQQQPWQLPPEMYH